ncbi:MAG: hypothetical protein LPL00_05975 [Alphaproteobacteria bacterium]|nr:hypothetical protein [Alphaproteobacteria bacterium]MDX5369096.1 hypothetical protein [Alphaproteobacteria bacterium]MDX5463789.1 hypothetical protein [Alphaproteobacteria bacterium]
MATGRDDRRHDREDEAARALKRVAGEGGGLTGHTERAAGGPPDEATDPAAIWGKRIGRTAGLVVLAWLLYHLISTYLIGTPG